ncbi:MAG: DUF459 domain-containing protein [Azonexus sp.]|nr:DUF459 domain-containing protein [Azonexus sp.]
MILIARPVAAAPDAPEILVIGDSQAQGVAGALQRLYMRSREYRIDDKSRIGTGLMFKSNYDWPAAVEQLAAAGRPAVAVIMFGANDRPAIRIKGVVDQKLLASFSATYSGRVANIVKSLKKANIQVIWVSHPVVKDAEYNEDMAALNQIMKKAAEQEGARWVSLQNITGEDSDAYSATGKALDGKTHRLRADDGIHFTPVGYDLVAARVEPVLKSIAAPLPGNTVKPVAGIGVKVVQ